MNILPNKHRKAMRDYYTAIRMMAAECRRNKWAFHPSFVVVRTTAERRAAPWRWEW